MKGVIFIFSACFLFLSIQAQNNDTLTNETIIKLSKSGFGTQVLKSKISVSPARFDVSLNGMMKLKENNVPEELINLMIKYPGGYAPMDESKPGNEINQQRNSGIYFIKTETEKIEMVFSYIDRRKTDKTAQYLVSNLINANMRVIMNEEHASFEITDNRPKFQFVFDTLKSADENSWFGRSSSPQDFILIKFRSVNQSRELIVGKSNGFRDKIEIKENQKVLFNYKKIATGIYEVSPISELVPGEYGFIFSNSSWDTQSGKVYDFRIINDRKKEQPPKEPA
jgi:hypothetical protein